MLSATMHDLRFAPDGRQREDCVLNLAPYRSARIMVAERNFGCGSSRENAVWALYDYGIRAAIAPSFGDIFNNNGLKNGLLPVVLPEAAVGEVLRQLQAAPGAEMSVDLERLVVTAPDGSEHPFEIEPFARHCLLQGVDELGYTLEHIDQIAAFERRYGRENA